MTNKRYVLFKPSNAGEVQDADLSGIRSLAQVVDSIGSRAFLVEASESAVEELRNTLSGWTIEEERIHGLPEDPGRPR